MPSTFTAELASYYFNNTGDHSKKGLRWTQKSKYIYLGLSRYFGGTVTAVTVGRDGTVKPPSKWSRRPVPSRPVDKFPDRLHIPSRPADKIPPVKNYRPVPPWHRTITVPSRRDTEKLPSRPADKMPLPPRDTCVRGRLFPSIPTTNHEISKIKSSCTKIYLVVLIFT